MVDKNINAQIGAFLALAKPTAADIRAAARLLLQIYPQRYRAVFNTVMAEADPTPFADGIAKELKKHHTYLKDDVSREEVAVQDKKILAEISTVLTEDTEPSRGKRPDHDDLPDSIKAIWEENGKRYKSMKKVFNTLKGLENAEPCDRYEFVKQLKDAYDIYKQRMAEYDEYKAGQKEEVSADNIGDITKKVSSARAYISKNKEKVAALKDDASKVSEYQKKLSALQERVDILIAANAEFDKAALAELGLNVE